MFCSSIPGYGIPLGKDMYEYLRNQFQENNLHVILLLSENYCDSVPCLNEMGALWVLRHDYDMILLPGYNFKEIEGAVNPRKFGLKLDNDILEIKEKLNQLYDKIIDEFQLSKMPTVRRESKRDMFIARIDELDIIEKLMIQ